VYKCIMYINYTCVLKVPRIQTSYIITWFFMPHVEEKSYFMGPGFHGRFWKWHPTTNMYINKKLRYLGLYLHWHVDMMKIKILSLIWSSKRWLPGAWALSWLFTVILLRVFKVANILVRVLKDLSHEPHIMYSSHCSCSFKNCRHFRIPSHL
jgi:hypothetical protein